MEYVANQRYLSELLARHGFDIKKKFGQNFLVDQNILRKIVQTSGTNKHTDVIEIGPGVGALTQFLAEEARCVHAFEIDTTLEPLLEETVYPLGNAHVYFEDFLKVDLSKKDFAQADELRIVANLPYYITTPILERIIEWYAVSNPNLKSATVMMQKEVAQRLSASPGTKAYGSLSIFTQLFADVELAFLVSKNVFIPKPNVDSAIVQLTFKPNEIFASFDESVEFMEFVRNSFVQRRKTLYNNLKENFESEDILAAFSKMEMDAKIRAEALTTSEFHQLYLLLK